MTYIISLEDGGGQEFFLDADGEMAGIATRSPQKPQEFSSYRATAKKVDALRAKYPKTCQLYAVEKAEFDERRRQLQTSSDEVADNEQA